jgi:hypothetical protein
MSDISDFFGSVGTTGGGLSWSVVSTNTISSNGNGYLFDNSSSSHTLSLPSSPEVGDTVAAGDLTGDFQNYSLTIDRNGSLIMGVAEDLTLDVRNQRVTLVYSGATRGWVIVDELFGAHPKTVLNKPFMHVQDQKPSGTNGGSSVVGWQTRDLNTVLHNDITGASLSGNQVTLPAGTYYVEASVPAWDVATHKAVLHNVVSLQDVLIGSSERNGSSKDVSTRTCIHGVVSTAESTTFSIRHYTSSAEATSGLGAAVSQGTEVYSDLRIWQLDRSIEIAPVAVNSGLQTVPGLDTTGNIMGFNLSKTGANQVTVSKGSCLDSTLTVPLALTADTAVAIPAVANTIYHVFVVRLVADGTFTVKAYTSEAGVASDSTVDKWRWVGFCVTDGSTEVYGFEHTENVITFDSAGITFQSSIGAQTAVSSTTSFIPSTRIEDITVCAIASSSSSFTWGYVGLLNNGVWMGIAYTPSRGRGMLIGPLHLATLESCDVECLVQAGTPSGSLHISTVTIKR